MAEATVAPSAQRAPGRWREPGARAVLAACAATAVAHLLFLTRQLDSDEGGFAMVARHWDSPGDYLYGPQWVDRPPALIAVFDLANHLGPYGVRIAAAFVAVILVGAVTVAAGTVGGRTAAAWSAWTAFAFSSSVLLKAQELNGELVAATFVAVTLAALLVSLRPGVAAPTALLAAGVAGAAGATAVLTKQNFMDGLVFAAVLVGLSLLRSGSDPGHPRRRLGVVAAGVAGGSVVVGLAALVWAGRHGGVTNLLYAMYGFRRDAAAVMEHGSWHAPLDRLGLLVLAGLVSGLLLLGAHLIRTHWRLLAERSPLGVALTAAAGVELLGIVAGANFWMHYLIALVPTVAVAAGLAARPGRPGARGTRRLVVYAVAVTVVAAPIGAVIGAGSPRMPFATGQWLADSSQSGDSVVVTYSHPDVIEASGLTPVYPYSWSLPVRTLDPDLQQLGRTLDGAGRPTWVVEWDDRHSWGLDPDRIVESTLHAHYRLAATVCEHEVWLRADIDRRLAPVPPESGC